MRGPSDEEPLGGLPRNFLRPCVLLLLRRETSHGYELLERLGRFGIPRPDPGGLYRTLRAMEREGLVRSWWETSHTGPARRAYALTAEGEEWLHAWAGALRETRRSVDRFLEEYAENAERPQGRAGNVR